MQQEEPNRFPKLSNAVGVEAVTVMQSHGSAVMKVANGGRPPVPSDEYTNRPKVSPEMETYCEATQAIKA